MKQGNRSFGGQVGGNTDLNAQDITALENSRVGGVLRYQSSNNVPIPAGVATAVQQEQLPIAEVAPQPNPVWTFLSWLWRTIFLVIGLALLAWVRVAPKLLFSTTYAIEARPVEVGIYGIVVAALIPARLVLAGISVVDCDVAGPAGEAGKRADRVGSIRDERRHHCTASAQPVCLDRRFKHCG